MKKCIRLIIALFLTVLFTACAEDQDAGIRSALEKSGINNAAQVQAWGDTAACIAEKDGMKCLCVLEKTDGAWRISVCNPNALRQDWDAPTLLLDTDTALFWTYRHGDTDFQFTCSKDANGNWGNVNLILMETMGDRIYESLFSWREDAIEIRSRTEDENENLLDEEAAYLPAPELSGAILLPDFDVERFFALEFLASHLLPDND